MAAILEPHQRWFINHSTTRFISHFSLCHHHKYGGISGDKNSAAEAAWQDLASMNVENNSWATKAVQMSSILFSIVYKVLIVYQLVQHRVFSDPFIY